MADRGRVQSSLVPLTMEKLHTSPLTLEFIWHPHRHLKTILYMYHDDIKYKNIQPYILFWICWQESGTDFIVGNKDWSDSGSPAESKLWETRRGPNIVYGFITLSRKCRFFPTHYHNPLYGLTQVKQKETKTHLFMDYPIYLCTNSNSSHTKASLEKMDIHWVVPSHWVGRECWSSCSA